MKKRRLRWVMGDGGAIVSESIKGKDARHFASLWPLSAIYALIKLHLAIFLVLCWDNNIPTLAATHDNLTNRIARIGSDD